MTWDRDTGLSLLVEAAERAERAGADGFTFGGAPGLSPATMPSPVFTEAVQPAETPQEAEPVQEAEPAEQVEEAAGAEAVEPASPPSSDPVESARSAVTEFVGSQVGNAQNVVASGLRRLQNNPDPLERPGRPTVCRRRARTRTRTSPARAGLATVSNQVANSSSSCCPDTSSASATNSSVVTPWAERVVGGAGPLDDRTHREPLDPYRPPGGSRVVFALGQGERDQHVGVEEVRARHSSSGALATYKW